MTCTARAREFRKPNSRISFSLFFRGSNKTTSEGSGIGLSLAQRIVSLHGAKLSLDSAPGEGTTMRIHWPNR